MPIGEYAAFGALSARSNDQTCGGGVRDPRAIRVMKMAAS
jgi:hypothetical protein